MYLFLAVGFWFIYLSVRGFRGKSVGVFGQIVGRPFKQQVSGWSARLAPIALLLVGAFLIYYGVFVLR